MKCEIIKGSEKDFDGAPENTLTVYRLKGSRRTHLSPYRADEFAVGVEIIAERRPITEPVVNQRLTTEWDGTGIPPVGTQCEIFVGDAGWTKGKIMYNGAKCSLLLDETGEDWFFSRKVAKFRHIRSPEDVARDEAALDLFLTINFNDTEADWVVMGARRNDYYKAIDAGYRKTPTVSELMRVTENATREDCEAIVKMMGGKK